jgi:starch phosphorylase
MSHVAVPTVAYYCMEFGLSERLPIYAGGLGVLAGDFLRAAHALRLPVVGVGLLWGDGYTTQAIGPDDHPEDHPTRVDRSLLHREEEVVSVHVAGRDVPLAIWRCDAFDNATLYLLEPTEERDRAMTRRLYGGDEDMRVAQEILLGVGGVRALDAMGIDVDVHHFNEGHAVFAGLELIRRERAKGASFEEAWARVRPRIVFTTHTPVDAGNERHDHARLRKMGATLGFTEAEVTALGGTPFNMTAAGLRLASRANAVAELHGETARAMWRHVEDGAPIVSITNGVDHRVWQDEALAAYPLSDEDLDAARARLRRELLDAVAARTGVRLDPERLTIGFARRATAYKRATLFFHDRPRAEAMLEKGELQLVFAGKNHPKDVGGRQLIAELVALSRKFPSSVVFVPDYDMELGRLITRGCDVWMNTPRRPLEACGTSGMKAAMNGVLNLSILDGWWVEGCEHGVTGWRIGEPRWHESEAEGDELDAADLHDVLEREVVPTFYGDRAKWRKMMRASIAMAIGRFTADRMLREYYEKLYPHHAVAMRAAG